MQQKAGPIQNRVIDLVQPIPHSIIVIDDDDDDYRDDRSIRGKIDVSGLRGGWSRQYLKNAKRKVSDKNSSFSSFSPSRSSFSSSKRRVVTTDEGRSFVKKTVTTILLDNGNGDKSYRNVIFLGDEKEEEEKDADVLTYFPVFGKSSCLEKILSESIEEKGRTQKKTKRKTRNSFGERSVGADNGKPKQRKTKRARENNERRSEKREPDRHEKPEPRLLDELIAHHYQFGEVPLEQFQMMEEFESARESSEPSVPLNVPKYGKGEKIFVWTEGEETCTICLQDFDSGQKIKETECHHLFHWKCLKQWYKVSTSCPVCKTRRRI